MTSFFSQVHRWPLIPLCIIAISAIVVGCVKTESYSTVSSSESGTRSADQSPEDYVLDFQVHAVSSRHVITVNGFPVEKQDVMSRATADRYDVDLSPALVEEENRVTVRMIPYLRSRGGQLRIAEISYSGKIRRQVAQTGANPVVDNASISKLMVDSVYQAWVERARTKWESYHSPEGALDSIRTWAQRHPMSVSTTFENTAGPDYSRIFEGAPVIRDTARLKDYAMHLRDLFAQRDTLGVYEAHRPKFDAIDFSRAEALKTVGSSWLSHDWHLDFDRKDLALRRWSSGRVWEIYRDDALTDTLRKEALLLAGEGRLATWHTIYVAEIDDALKVVR